MNSKTPLFKKSVTALLLGIILLIYYMQRDEKPKTLFNKVDGITIGLEKTNDNYPRKDSSKYRYLKIDNYPKPFELFVGKSDWDFKPKLEYIDNLKLGDPITIYFDETYKTKMAPVNNLAFFIDRGHQAIFIKGDSKKYLNYGMIAFCGILISILVVLKRKGKIV